jgi:hypothetical protein
MEWIAFICLQIGVQGFLLIFVDSQSEKEIKNFRWWGTPKKGHHVAVMIFFMMGTLTTLGCGEGDKSTRQGAVALSVKRGEGVSSFVGQVLTLIAESKKLTQDMLEAARSNDLARFRAAAESHRPKFYSMSKEYEKLVERVPQGIPEKARSDFVEGLMGLSMSSKTDGDFLGLALEGRMAEGTPLLEQALRQTVSSIKKIESGKELALRAIQEKRGS